MKKFAVFLLIVAVYAVHQDWFFFKVYKPLGFGFLPIGLWYHGLYAFLCALMFWILGATVWPKELEAAEEKYKDVPSRGGH